MNPLTFRGLSAPSRSWRLEFLALFRDHRIGLPYDTSYTVHIWRMPALSHLLLVKEPWKGPGTTAKGRNMFPRALSRNIRVHGLRRLRLTPTWWLKGFEWGSCWNFNLNFAWQQLERINRHMFCTENTGFKLWSHTLNVYQQLELHRRIWINFTSYYSLLLQHIRPPRCQ